MGTRLDAIDVSRLPKSIRDQIGPISTKRRHKHRAIPITVQGIKFQSTKEGNRYCELQRLLSAGQIRNLRRQVTYILKAENGVPFGKYVADFVYDEVATGLEVVEDTKGFDRRTRKFRTTEAYRLKRAYMLAAFGITIREA